MHLRPSSLLLSSSASVSDVRSSKRTQCICIDDSETRYPLPSAVVSTSSEDPLHFLKVRLALEKYDIQDAMRQTADKLSQLDVIQNSAEDYVKILSTGLKIAGLNATRPNAKGANLKVSLEKALFIFELVLNETAEEALARIEEYKNETFPNSDSLDVYCVGINFQRMDAHRLVYTWAVNLYSGNGTLKISLPPESRNVVCWRNRTAEPANPMKRVPSTMRREPVRDYYDILEEVGRGLQGKVYECVERSSGKIFAARFVKVQTFIMRDMIYEEINIMLELRDPGHPNLLTLHEAFDNDAEIILIVDR